MPIIDYSKKYKARISFKAKVVKDKEEKNKWTYVQDSVSVKQVYEPWLGFLAMIGL